MATQLYLSGVSAVSGGVLDLNGANIELLPGWRPRVAKRRRGVLGGKRHEDVVESIPLRVFGASPADCVQFLELMAAAMDQARNWNDGAAVDVVILNYAINGTTLANPLQAAVLGTPADAADILELPVTFNSYLQVFEVNPVTLPLERRGEWLGDEETRSRTGSANFNPGVMTPSANFSESLITSGPYKLTITWNNLSGPPGANAMIFTARSTGRLVLLQGEAELGGDNFASASDTDASGGNVGRYTPADTNANTANWNITIDSDVRLVHVVAHLKNRSASISYNVRAHVNGAAYGRMHTIDASNNDPQLLSLGPLVSPSQAITQLELEITASGIGDASHSLDIDTIAVLAAEADSTVLAVDGVANAASSPVIDHALLTRAKPLVTTSLTGMTHSGVPYLWNSGNTAAALVLGGTGTSWRIRSDVAAALQIGATWVRRPAYLVPR